MPVFPRIFYRNFMQSRENIHFFGHLHSPLDDNIHPFPSSRSKGTVILIMMTQNRAFYGKNTNLLFWEPELITTLPPLGQPEKVSRTKQMEALFGVKNNSECHSSFKMENIYNIPGPDGSRRRGWDCPTRSIWCPRPRRWCRQSEVWLTPDNIQTLGRGSYLRSFNHIIVWGQKISVLRRRTLYLTKFSFSIVFLLVFFLHSMNEVS